MIDEWSWVDLWDVLTSNVAHEPKKCRHPVIDQSRFVPGLSTQLNTHGPRVSPYRKPWKLNNTCTRWLLFFSVHSLWNFFQQSQVGLAAAIKQLLAAVFLIKIIEFCNKRHMAGNYLEKPNAYEHLFCSCKVHSTNFWAIEENGLTVPNVALIKWSITAFVPTSTSFFQSSSEVLRVY